MDNLTYLLLLLIMAIATIALIPFILALKSKTFDWSWIGDPWPGEYMEAPWFNQWTGVPYGIRSEIRRGSEPFRYALKVARMNLTPEEERILREASESGGVKAFKRSLDLIEACRERGASPEEYAEHHRRKELDMR